MMDFTLTMPAPGPLGDLLDGGMLLSALRANSPQITQLLINAIRDRTPHATGALAEDEDGRAYTGGVSGARVVALADLFCATDAQTGEYGRVYAQYQEGPPLGLTTYTNDPHQMFFLVASENLSDISDWAEATLDAAVDDLVSALPTQTLGTNV